MKLSKNKMLILFFVVLISLVGLIYYFSKSKRQMDLNPMSSGTSAMQTGYHCVMHPGIHSHEPGQCPICHMNLVKDDESENSQTAHEPQKITERKILFYRNPMNPEVRSQTPAKDNMGMDYIAVYADENSGSPTTNVSGRGAFSLSNEKQQTIGVTSAEVKKEKLTSEIRATGRVAFDPELYTAIEEYRQSIIGRNSMGDTDYKGMKEQANALVASSKTKLKLMGLTNEQIQKLSRTDASALNLLLPAGKVWVYAEVFEYEISGVKPGQLIEADAPSNPGEIFRGKISSISPVLNAPTRTVRVRAEVPDPKSMLRPDTYLNVRILKDLGEKLAVPEDSVLHSEGKDYVFVQKDNQFTPRAVTLGPKAGSKIEVVSGLLEGERVVTGANFLLDSESRLKAVLTEKATTGGQQ